MTLFGCLSFKVISNVYKIELCAIRGWGLGLSVILVRYAVCLVSNLNGPVGCYSRLSLVDKIHDLSAFDWCLCDIVMRKC